MDIWESIIGYMIESIILLLGMHDGFASSSQILYYKLWTGGKYDTCGFGYYQSSVSVRLCLMKFWHDWKSYYSTLGYVGAATVGAAAYWFLYDDEGPKVTYYQLVSPYFYFSNLDCRWKQLTKVINPFPLLSSLTSCSAMMKTRTLLELNVRCLRLLLPWPWPCLCWSPLRCAMLLTGEKTFSRATDHGNNL